MRSTCIRLAAVASALLLAACGGGPDAASTAVPAADTTTSAPSDQPQRSGRVLGEDVRPESSGASNVFPDLVVDDVGRGTKANLANIFPAERPVLLWMWAPY